MAKFTQAPATQLDAASQELFPSFRGARLGVLCGRNNSGKSFLLRRLIGDLGQKAYYLGPSRYYSFSVFQAYTERENRVQERHSNQLSSLNNALANVDAASFDLAQAIAELPDAQRAKLLKVLDELLGSKTQILNSNLSNNMSPKYIDVDGYNLAFQSSGYRLAATLLTCLFDVEISTLIIDEPELGLSPEVQGTIADFLYDETRRIEYFSHLNGVIVATHSPIFIDRKTPSNNFFVTRKEQTITIKRQETIQDINSLQFLLLGNRFETLHLPSAIVLVEGITDYTFLNRLIALRYPHSLVSIVRCDSDNRIKEVLNVARQMLVDLRRSPYANRIFAVLDQKHAAGLTAELMDMGLATDNVIVWTKNGIEHLYPKGILESKFGQFELLNIEEDVVSMNGVVMKKKELADFVVAHMTGQEVLDAELHEKLLGKLDALLVI